MTRYPDWQERFEAFIASRRAAAFSWAKNDCGYFVADSVESITGERVCTDLRGYRGKRGALRTLEAVGGVHALAVRAFGEPVPPLLARVGDVVLVDHMNGNESLAVCLGATVVAPGVGSAGLIEASLRQAKAAWRIG